MNPQELEQIRWFKSGPVSLESSKIDTEAGIIYDVVMCQEGEAKGHGVHLEADFIEGLIAYDKKYFGKVGLKGRFGHPNASDDTMGTQLGVFTNFRKREENGKMQAIADLHLLKSASISPTHPGMREWVLQIAEERPDFVMLSIVFMGSGYYQRDEKNKKVKVWAYDDEGNWLYSNSQMPVYVEFDEKKGAAHFYTDLVESGAATENLFSNQVNTHLYAAQVDTFLSDNPHLVEFLKQNPDAVGRWLARAGYTIQTQQKKTMSKFSIKAWLFGESQEDVLPTPEELSEMRTALSESRDEIKKLREERDSWKQKFEDADKRATELSEQAATLRTQVEQLSADISALNERLSTVEKRPAAQPTSGESNEFNDGRNEKKSAMPIWDSFRAENGIK